MLNIPEISIILALHDQAPNLYQCLDSVYWQTFSDIEVICVIYSSTDCVLNIVREFVAKDNRWRIIDMYNGCISSARNAGLDAAKGKYVLFLDSKDCIAHQLCELVHKQAEKWQAEVVFFNILQFNHQGMNADCLIKYPEINGCFQPISLFEILAWANLFNGLYRLDLIDDIRFMEGIEMEDQPFLTELYIRAKQAVLLNEPLYYLRDNVPYSSHDCNHGNLLPFFCCIDAVRDILKRYDVYDSLYETIYAVREIRSYMGRIKTIPAGLCFRFFSMAKLRSRFSNWDNVVESVMNLNYVHWPCDKEDMHFLLCLKRGNYLLYLLRLMTIDFHGVKRALLAFPVVGRLFQWGYAFSRIVSAR
jgi:glycosyltransferase involved in cell wall biosynthesis